MASFKSTRNHDPPPEDINAMPTSIVITLSVISTNTYWPGPIHQRFPRTATQPERLKQKWITLKSRWEKDFVIRNDVLAKIFFTVDVWPGRSAFCQRLWDSFLTRKVNWMLRLNNKCRRSFPLQNPGCTLMLKIMVPGSHLWAHFPWFWARTGGGGDLLLCNRVLVSSTEMQFPIEVDDGGGVVAT